MSQFTDVLSTVFAVQGVQQTVAAFNSVQDAQRRLQQSEERIADARANGTDTMAQAHSLANANAAAALSAERLAAVMATVTVSAFRQVITVVDEAIQRYGEFTRAALNLRDITGSSGAEAASFTAAFNAIGINDRTILRDFLRIARDTNTPHGQKALSEFGVHVTPGTTGTQAFLEASDGISKLQDGLQKTAAMQQLLGVRGVDAFLPWFRATDAQRQALLGLSTVSEENLEVMQRFQISSAILGATWEQKVVFPILGLVMPALTQLIGGLQWVMDLFAGIQSATHGIAGFVIVLGAMATGVVVLGVALAALSTTLIFQNTLLAIRAALTGNWAGLAIAAGVGAVALGAGAFALNALDKSKNPDHSRDAHTRAMMAHTEALKTAAEDWTGLLQVGIPKGLNSSDIQQLARQTALGAIG